MNRMLLLLLLLVSPSCYAVLYKCSFADKTIYQDKPCQIMQLQSVIAEKNYPQTVQPPSAVGENIAVIARDAHGRIKRSEKAKDDFKAENPCPATNRRSGACPGYVIDHINPLACGGADSPENMQWQTVADGKAKDGWEREKCSLKKIVTIPFYSSPSRQFESSITDNASQTVYIGKRGGRYVISKSGKKHYLKR